jgi:hypothetical protein
MLNLIKQARQWLYFAAGIALFLVLSWISLAAPQAASAISANGLFSDHGAAEQAYAQSGTQAEDLSYMTPSRTHQEPNFYQ